MMYVKTIDGAVSKFPYSTWELRQENPNTSFPKSLTSEILESYGVYAVTENKPDFDHLVQTLTAGTPAPRDGVWQVDYVAVNLSEEDAKNAVRSERNNLLSETDWVALSDVVMSSEMTAYRQSLRDIPQQQGFPFSVVWPTKPKV